MYQGSHAVDKVRDIAGPTNPHLAREQKPGSIRSLGTVVPLKNTEGEVIGERMDNLIHASATYEEAEREIKLWFKPIDIPPFMRVFATQRCETHFYYRDTKLFTSYEPDSVCVFTPGDAVWKSDLNVLQLIHQGSTTPRSLQSVVA